MNCVVLDFVPNVVPRFEKARNQPPATPETIVPFSPAREKGTKERACASVRLPHELFSESRGTKRQQTYACSGGIVMLFAQMWWDEYLLVAMWNFTMAKFIE